MPNPVNPYDLQLLRRQAAINKRILQLYQDAIQQITVGLSTINYKGKLFTLKDYPALQAKVEAVIKKMQPQIYTAVVNGIKDSWDLSNKKNDVLVDKRVADKRKLKPKVRQVLYDPNKQALNAFLSRKDKGINLSDRVWNLLGPFQKEMEQGLGFGISKGQSAAEMAKDLKRYLNEPDRLFRRVRNEEGKLVLSAAARNYHPGQGVYRSSYKNALRLTRTENNLAYRNADFVRWQKLPFVTGIRVKLSNAHPRYDICDKLVGLYPKDFHFSGWHPQCICFATPEMLSDAEYDKLEDQILAGQPVTAPSTLFIKQPPAGFSSYLNDNKKMLARLKSEPYWMRDNPQYLDSTPQSLAITKTAGGQKISTQFTKISSGVKSQVNHALESIDAVHGDGTLDDIPFKSTASKKYNAVFVSTYSGKAKEILLNKKSIGPELSISHEMGHYLDLYSIGEKGRFNSVIKDSPVNKVVQVAKESDAIKAIQKILDDGKITVEGKEQLLSPYTRKHLRYLLAPEEIWARSYAQFIAKKSNSSKMLTGLDDLAKLESKSAYKHQWDDDDFEAISNAIEEMMIELGWIVSL